MPKGPILLLENDLELIENTKTTFNQIQQSILEPIFKAQTTAAKAIRAISRLSRPISVRESW